MSTTLKLKVAEARQSDVGMARARIGTRARMDIDVEVGDIVEIIGERSTAARVFRVVQEEDEAKDILRIDSLIRRNAGVSIGDMVEVKKAEVSPAGKVVLAPMISSHKKVSFGEGIEEFVRRGLKQPLVKGDTVIIPGIALVYGALPFMVVNTNPEGIVTIDPSSDLVVKEEAVSEDEETGTRVAYEDIGGLRDELQRVREMIELPLRHPELFRRLGIDPPKGVLLYGPPGTGKTLIAKAVANEAGASMYTIQGPEIMSKYYGQSEEQLRNIFEEAEKNAPSVIFMDEIDSIAPNRDNVQGEVERRVVAQLLTLMDGMSARGNVIVIAATNREGAIDPALRRPGRFDREIEIGVPGRRGRKEILQIHTRGMPLEGDDTEKDQFLQDIADNAYGFVGADVAALARESAMRALRRYLPEIDLNQSIPAEVLQKMVVTKDDFHDAIREIEPSGMREVLVEVPRVSWDDVGGLDDIKERLKESVELPLNKPEVFERMGIRPPMGILLYGPPGTGKTLMAKAVANESKANFISIKGPEIMSKWVGESEKAVRMIFKKAKQVSPTIIFLDEIDAIAPARGSSSDTGVTERIVNQLLTSIDGMEALGDIIVIAATNRPDILDRALIRPGRIDRIFYIDVPNADARTKIVEVHTKSMPLADDVSTDWIVENTKGFVGADIESLCREAAMCALRGDIESKEVQKKDFEEALKEVHASVDEETIKYYKSIKEHLEREVPKKKADSHSYYA